MTVVSSKEFAINQRKFYNMAVNERIIIKRGKNMFYLTGISIEDDESSDLADTIAAENDENIDVDDFIRYLRGTTK